MPLAYPECPSGTRWRGQGVTPDASAWPAQAMYFPSAGRHAPGGGQVVVGTSLSPDRVIAHEAEMTRLVFPPMAQYDRLYVAWICLA